LEDEIMPIKVAFDFAKKIKPLMSEEEF